jgi:hypothetical protein
MSKKKNKQAKKVLSSFADLGNTGKNTLSRLATTVKADMPTVILGNKDPFAGTVKTDGLKGFGDNKVSRIAKRLIPFRAAGNVQAKPAAARLKHIAGKMGNAAMPKTRKSKGMIWLFIFFTALAGAGYYAYSQFEGLGEKVVQTIDYKSWLDKTSGKVKPSEVRTAGKSTATKSAQVVKSSAAQKKPVVSTAKSSTVKTKTLAVKKATAKKATAKKAVKNGPAQKKQWESRLAKLKKKSEADYRKASMKYRNNHK